MKNVKFLGIPRKKT